MKNLLKIFFIFIFIILPLSVLTENKVYGVNDIQSTVSMRYLQGVKTIVKLDLNDDNTYYVIQTSSDDNRTYASIFGEDALTEENVLKFFIFNENNINSYGHI